MDVWIIVVYLWIFAANRRIFEFHLNSVEHNQHLKERHQLRKMLMKLELADLIRRISFDQHDGDVRKNHQCLEYCALVYRGS